MEKFILGNKYDDACRILSNLDLSSIDLEGLLRTIIRMCSIVEEKELFCSNFLIYFIKNFEDLLVKTNLASNYFDLILAILKLCVPNALNLSFHLLKKRNFYSSNDLMDLIEICISYDRLIDEKYYELEEIIDFISEKIIPIYSKISELVQPMILDAIVRWSDQQFHGGDFVYRMGRSLLNLINPETITEEICLKFISILQTRIDCHNEEINQKKRLLFWVRSLVQTHSISYHYL
jgi:hypothetical protein